MNEQVPKEKVNQRPNRMNFGYGLVGDVDFYRALSCWYYEQIERLTAERDQYKGQAEINAQTVIRQAQEIRKLEHAYQVEAMRSSPKGDAVRS